MLGFHLFVSEGQYVLELKMKHGADADSNRRVPKIRRVGCCQHSVNTYKQGEQKNMKGKGKALIRRNTL